MVDENFIGVPKIRNNFWFTTKMANFPIISYRSLVIAMAKVVDLNLFAFNYRKS